MKKLTKKLMGMVLALVLCLAAVPAEVSMAAEVDYTKLTQEQLEAIVFGEWEDGGSPINVSETSVYYDGELWIGWNYEGMVEYDEAILNEDDYEVYHQKRMFGDCSLEEYIDGYIDEDLTGEELDEAVAEATEEYNNIISQNPDGVTNTLKFTNGDNKYYMYYGFDGTAGEPTLLIHMMFEDGSQRLQTLFFKVVNDTTLKFDEVVESLGECADTDVTEEPTTSTEDVTAEGPTVEEVTTTGKPEETTTPEPSEEVTTTEKTEEPAATEPKEEITATEKETVSKTTDGRDVYAGEEVYKVVKGDCLWSIAKKFFGNGAKYKELFTRNNGIIEKAELIFPGQEIIYIPAK